MRATIAQAALRRDITRVSERRHALPDGPVIETDYRFKEVNGQDVGLLDRFGDKGALVTYSGCTGPSASGRVRCAQTCSAR